MSYTETLSYLYQNLPMFQRVGSIAYKPNLTNTLKLCEVLGNPHQKFKSIHVAGTNGKGSVSHMLASILQTAGYKTGLYTSPHLKEFTERIRINGKEIDPVFVVEFVEKIKPEIEKLKPSFFEITVAMAFDYFAQQKVDIAVIETGMGGRLDSTNVITPMLSVITNISWDHKELLGDTLQKIASEKAGIIKAHVPVVVSERQEEVQTVFESKATECISQLIFASDRYQVKRIKPGQFEVSKNKDHFLIELDLLGIYQAKNIKGVLTAVDELIKLGCTISKEDITNGLKYVTNLTGLKGRWQQIGHSPLTICDTGHNEAGIYELLNQLKEIKVTKLHWVLGVVKDKDVSAILQLLPKDAYYYYCQASLPRALPALELKEKATSVGLKGIVVEDVNQAIKQARINSKAEDLVLVAGSTFVVAEIDNL
ncbi:MAG: bifunctional folylpolyglutamate synthase/dihydrofolate synthase [Cyclobacteriaceae bacterium]|nr:bifunctional folylpolyglutamate synthase/dihydrofolate synthase [Cyclobacteriaceae bacterium]